jgi:carbon-monoxide dehydrogenase medium subunit
MDCAVVGVAAALVLEESTSGCKSARIALGAVAPTPVRMREVEHHLEGKRLAEISHPELARLVQMGIEPISDVRGSAAYRQEIAAVLTLRAVNSLMNGKER